MGTKYGFDLYWANPVAASVHHVVAAPRVADRTVVAHDAHVARHEPIAVKFRGCVCRCIKIAKHQPCVVFVNSDRANGAAWHRLAVVDDRNVSSDLRKT